MRDDRSLKQSWGPLTTLKLHLCAAQRKTAPTHLQHARGTLVGITDGRSGLARSGAGERRHAPTELLRQLRGQTLVRLPQDGGHLIDASSRADVIASDQVSANLVPLELARG